ncbi:hypothetical protein P5G51_015260 [Virgibacillus sp. 179-BFC.A HS]|uniref:Uncharacterized protein n=1 Tax=Tigheibacillus jepli TaxID=3035914 RepID=A0ABU5CKV2_9BACI|nr:hypothetical protein [Virgibacillus sp. 179-BFC.A HS]MDY0406541.1 hypothetical protein [Virgibacillus sp. 179-BFC.A HS]
MVQKLVDLVSISKSQLSRKLRDIPPEIFQAIFHHLVQQLHQRLGITQGNKDLGEINLIDKINFLGGH